MTRRRNRSSRGGWLFLALVLACCGLAFLINPEPTKEAMTFFKQALRQLIPILAVVFILLLITNLVLAPAKVKQYLGKESGLKGWLATMFAGVFSVGPVYAWYAVLAELQKQGMRTALVAAFLYCRAVKLPLLPMMIYYFGSAFTLVLCSYLVIFSVVNGIVTEKLMRNRA